MDTTEYGDGCEGDCENHVGRVIAVHVTGKDHDWGEFNYCEEAMAEDKRRGFVVTPSKSILEQAIVELSRAFSALRQSDEELEQTRARWELANARWERADKKVAELERIQAPIGDSR